MTCENTPKCEKPCGLCPEQWPVPAGSEVPTLADRLSDEADQCRNDGAEDIAKLLDEAAEALHQSQPMIPLSAMRPIAVEAIRAVTGCPDIKGNGLYLVDELESVAKAAALSTTPANQSPAEGDALSIAQEALQKLANLGNGDKPGNSIGNLIAQEALAALANVQPKGTAAFNGWYCAHCQRGVDSSEVTYHEQHTVCGRVITDDVPPAQAPAPGAELTDEQIDKLVLEHGGYGGDDIRAVVRAALAFDASARGSDQ